MASGAALVLADHDQRADTLAIQTQILGIRHGHERFWNLLGDQPRAGGVGFQVDCEALISEIQEGHEPAAAQ